MEALKNEIVTNIRACLVSSKGHCTLRQLVGDYKTLIGADIEYRKFKFRSLEDFLKSVDSLTVRTVDGKVFVEAKADERSRHVAELIAKQKPPKRRRMPAVRHYQRGHAKPPQTRWRPRNVMSRGQAAAAAGGDARREQLAHRQYVKVTAAKENVACNDNGRPVNNNNAGEMRDLRDVLNERKRAERVPYSERTNRSKIMQGIVARNSAAVLGERQAENLRNESMMALDVSSPVWDSWTSSDDDTVGRKKREPLNVTGDTIEDLNAFTKYHRLPAPSYKIIPRSCKYPRKLLFDCKLQIGDQSYSSYPNEFYNETSVKKFVSSKALQELTAKHGKRASLLISNDQDVLDRIPELVRKHYHGIWMWQIEADYTDIYKEALPMNWLEVVDRSPMISVECVSEKRYLLRFCKPEDIFQKGKLGFSATVSDVSVPTNTIDFGEDGIITAEVTCVASAKEIWCRQLETNESEAFDVMVNNLTDIYNELLKRKALRKPLLITQGGYYVALVDGFWHRVCVFEAMDASANCFFIDYGEEQLVSKEHIFQLEREFAKRQAQAFICRLAGLEELYEVSAGSAHLHGLMGRIVHVETENMEVATHDPTASISVVFYDVETNESINQRLISEITIESATPILNKNGITEAHLSHVESNGDVYLNIPSPGLEKLSSLLRELEANVTESPPDQASERATPLNTKGRLFFARCKQDGRWRRVRFIDWAPNGEYAQIYFVDRGNCDVVRISGEVLYALDQLSDVIDQFPAQAVKVRMQIGRIPEDFVRRVRELMPPVEPVLLKVIEGATGADPVVKFFRRIGPNNDLCSVNESISFDDEREQRSSRSTPEKLQRLISLSKADDAKNVPSTGHLKGPPIPKVGEFFDVTIPTAVSPWNFFVQPYETKERLNELMRQMQGTYEKVQYSPLVVDDIQPGRIYASRHEDGKWYRTSVMKVIHPGSISVFYCDFGYYANLTLQQLVPLEPQFLELPYQAIKAKLHGITPKQSKWTMQDCRYFQKLVCRKSFVSILTEIEKDELYRCDNVLTLKLVDTSTDADIYIDSELVRKGIAVRSPEN